MKLEGKRIIVTGGGRGLGRSMALAFAREGADVAVCARRREDVDAVKTEIEATGRRGLAYSVDVADVDAVEAMVEDVAKQFGGIEVLVNNAGIGRKAIDPDRRDVEHLDLEAYERMWRTNVIGTLICSRAAIPHIRKAGGGSIILVGSQLGLEGRENYATYSSTKFAQEGISQSMAAELKSSNIAVNVVNPGTSVNTDFLAASAERKAHLPGPEMMDAVTVFLAEQDGSGVTGQHLKATEWNAEHAAG